MFIQEFPQLREEADSKIEQFIKDKTFRHKDSFPNIIDMLLNLLVSNKYKFEDVIAAYTEEQLDRQVFWLLKKFPEIEGQGKQSILDDDKLKAFFTGQNVSYRLTCFYKDYSTLLKGKYESWDKFFTAVELNNSKLPDAFENRIQELIFKCYNNMHSYNDYWKHVGLNFTGEETLTKLNQAMINSREKKYHGDRDTMFSVKPNNETITELQSKSWDIMDFYDTKDNKFVVADSGAWRTRCF